MTAKKKNEIEIAHELLLDSLFDGVYYVDLDRRIRYWNSSAERITGYSREEVMGLSCADDILVHVDCAGKEFCGDCPLEATMRDGKHREITAMVHHKRGFRVPVQVKSSPVRNGEGAIVGAVEIFTDNSNAMQLMEQFEKLKHDVFIDPLTGVGNRRYSDTMLHSLISDWQRNEIPFGVLFLDVDHFKNVNDTFGHETGDEVLIMVARTAANVVRKLDVFVRWGGEEFVALLPGANQATLESLAERIRKMIAGTFLMKGADKVTVTVSIGGTLVAAEDTAASVVARADANMYQSKKEGRNRTTIA